MHKGKASPSKLTDFPSHREAACDHIRFRTQYRNGNAVPFSPNGNIEWGVPVPNPDLTFGFTRIVSTHFIHRDIFGALASRRKVGQIGGVLKTHRSTDHWRGQRILHGPAQTAIFAGLTSDAPNGSPEEGQLQHTQLIVNKHLLFLNSKASSSGKIKPPMARELLQEYTAEQLRAHFISGLG